MKFSSYVWLALVVFLLGLIVLHQGWNNVALDSCSTQMPHEATTQESQPATAGVEKGKHGAGSSQSGADESVGNTTGSGHTGTDKAVGSTGGHSKQ